MFGIGSTELLLILVIALIVLGPKSLASVSRSLGKAMGEFRRVSTEFQRTLNVETAQEEAREAAKKNSGTTPSDTSQPFKDSGHTVNSAAEGQPDLPPDSPLAQAIAKARAQAEQASATAANTRASGSNNA